MTYSLDRRHLISLGSAALLMPTSSMAATTSVRAETVIDIAVKFLGITAYRYELAYTEVYRGGLLQSLSGTANDDGEPGYVRVVRNGDTLEVDGSEYSGAVGGSSAPTSYWRMPALQSTPWISTQSGELLAVNTGEIAALPHSPAGARVFRASDNNEYTVDLWYDSVGDWTGCSFDAGGELGIYTLESSSGSLTGFAT